MKIRRHEDAKSFRITFYEQQLVNGKMQRGAVREVLAEGNSVGEVRRGFLFGRDLNNTIFSISPA